MLSFDEFIDSEDRYLHRVPPRACKVLLLKLLPVGRPVESRKLAHPSKATPAGLGYPRLCGHSPFLAKSTPDDKSATMSDVRFAGFCAGIGQGSRRAAGLKTVVADACTHDRIGSAMASPEDKTDGLGPTPVVPSWRRPDGSSAAGGGLTNIHRPTSNAEMHRAPSASTSNGRVAQRQRRSSR